MGFPSSADVVHLPVLLGLKYLQDEGWTVKTTFFDTPEADYAALSSGDIQIAAGSTPAGLAAIQAGAKFHMLAPNQGVDWVLVGTPDINNCGDLIGKRFALHSLAGTTTSFAKAWLAANCTADQLQQVKPIYIPGAENRLAALLAGQIDATLLDYPNLNEMKAKAPDKFHEIQDFSKDPTIGKIKSSFFSVNDAWYAQNKDATVEFLKMMMKGYLDTKADPTLVAPLAQANNVQYDAPQQAALVDELSGALDPTLSVDESTMNFTIQFYVSTGNIQPGLEVSQVLNLEPLQAASQ